MHTWGDKDFDWDALNAAGDELYNYCRRWGRVGLHVKEKYGTLRAYTTCAFISNYDPIHSLVKCGHAFYRWPKWVRKIEWNVIAPIFNRLGIRYLIFKYQKFIYRRGYKRIVQKYPHIREEILCVADFPEWLEGL